MLGTVYFWRFRQNCAAAGGDHDVGHGADRRIRGDAAVAIRTPHSMPTISSLAGQVTRLMSLARGNNSPSALTSASTVARVPPVSWIVNIGGGVPPLVRAPSCKRYCRLAVSQPRPTSKYPPTLLCLANPASVRVRFWCSSPPTWNGAATLCALAE